MHVGVELVGFFVAHPREERTGSTELAKTWQCPTHKLMVVPLGNYGYLRMEIPQIAILIDFSTGQNIATDHPHIVRLHILLEHGGNRSTKVGAHVAGFCNFRSGERHDARSHESLR